MRTLTIVSPRTQAISPSRTCILDCEHCQGHFLKGMSDAPDLSNDSFLLSGGCGRDGVVQLDLGLLKELKGLGKRVNVHPGLVDEERAKLLGRYADAASFDFVSDDRVIQDIYHLQRTEADFIGSFEVLRRYCRTVPHVLIGFGNEERSLSILKGLGAQELCLIILQKHESIRNSLREPSLDRIESVLKFARPLFRRISLGCMRPPARKAEIDSSAVHYVDAIVNPHPSVDLSGYRKIEKHECCSFS